MIRGLGVDTTLTYSQTLNRSEVHVTLLNVDIRMEVSSGPFLVSRTGDAGWTERRVKVPEYTLI